MYMCVLWGGMGEVACLKFESFHSVGLVGVVKLVN